MRPESVDVRIIFMCQPALVWRRHAHSKSALSMHPFSCLCHLMSLALYGVGCVKDPGNWSVTLTK